MVFKLINRIKNLFIKKEIVTLKVTRFSCDHILDKEWSGNCPICAELLKFSAEKENTKKEMKFWEGKAHRLSEQEAEFKSKLDSLEKENLKLSYDLVKQKDHVELLSRERDQLIEKIKIVENSNDDKESRSILQKIHDRVSSISSGKHGHTEHNLKDHKWSLHHAGGGSHHFGKKAIALFFLISLSRTARAVTPYGGQLDAKSYQTISVSTVSCGSSTILVMSTNTARTSNLICNEGTIDVRIGPSTITTTVGQILFARSCATYDKPRYYKGSIWCISTGAAQVISATEGTP